MRGVFGVELTYIPNNYSGGLKARPDILIGERRAEILCVVIATIAMVFLKEIC
jgi:hypothetical protein